MTSNRIVDGNTILYLHIIDDVKSDSENSFYVHCVIFVRRHNLPYRLCHPQCRMR